MADERRTRTGREVRRQDRKIFKDALHFVARFWFRAWDQE